MSKSNNPKELVIPKSDTQAGPGLLNLEEAVREETDPLASFNEAD
ncbi:hypothetical protein [Desulforamulus ferrireducens]|nr:hypothetical protein [Desulforamulus ferrireducens]